MTSDDQIPGPETPPPASHFPESAAPAVDKDSSPANPSIQQSINPPSPHPAFGTAYRGNGNVARLPKSVRDQINNWMLDGVAYAEIIGRLGEQGKHLKPDHLYQWKKRGHKDWLVQQDWLAERRARRESAATWSRIATPPRSTRVPCISALSTF